MRFLNSIKLKVWFCAGLGMIGFLVATLSTYYSNGRVTHELDTLRDVTFPLSMRAADAKSLFSKQTGLYEDAFMMADEDSLAEGRNLDAPIRAELDEMVQILGAEDGSLLPFRARLLELRKAYADYALLASDRYGQLVGGGDVAALQNDIRRIGTLQQEILSGLDRLNVDLQQTLKGDISSIEIASNGNSRLIIILFLSVSLLSLLIVNAAAARLLVRPVRMVQEQAARLAGGDFAAVDRFDVNAGGEIGDLVQAIRQMAFSLRGMIGEITGSSRAIGGVSGNLQATAGQVAAAARKQVDDVTNTSTAMARISASVSEVGTQMERVSSTSEEITASVFEQAASTEEIAQNIDKLSESADHVNSSIIQVSSSIRQISESIYGLKDESDVTASSVAEMESSIRQVMQGAKDTAGIASSVHNDAEAGQQAVNETIEGMRRIKASSEIAATAIRSFSDKAENIGTILSVIDNLADETNLLALNAAIIAAQAGEHGRGFSVVADQIKELADQTSLSTREIVGIIDGVKVESRNAVTAIADAETNIQVGETLSLQSGAVLEKIVAGARQAVNEMDKISRATNEQVQGSGMIRASMDRVSDMVQQIVTAINEQEKGSGIIAQAAERVRDLVAQINLSVHEQSAASRTVASGMQDVNGMIRKVFDACAEQQTESDQIAVAIDSIRSSARQSLDSTEVVDAAVKALEEQVALLHKAVGRFNLSDGETGQG